MPTIRKPFFAVPFPLPSIVSGNVRAGYSALHLARPKASGLTWRTNGTANAWVRGDLGSAQSIDFASLVAANALPGTTIRLRLGTTQAEVDGAAPYDSTALPFISPSITRADGLYHSHLEIVAPVSARWWRIDIAGHTGDFEASTLVLGKRIEPSRFWDTSSLEYGVQDLGGIEIGRLGVVDETPGKVLRTIDFTLSWQTEVEFEASFRPLVEALGTRGIVHLAFDPESTTYRQARTYLGFFRKAPFARGVRKPRTFSMDFQLLSLI